MGKEIFIELFNPSRSYLAGQIIQGRVVVQNEKPLKVKEVTILLEGSGRVRWTETEHYTVHTTTTVNGQRKSTPQTRTRTISYYADEKYVSHKISLFGDGHNLTTLSAGYIAYPFQFVLPMNLPSSYTSRIGLVSYILEAELTRPFLKSNRRYVIPFTVNGIYDLNIEPGAIQPQENKQVKGSNFFACRKGQLGFILRLPRRSGFVPGEILDFSCEVTNSSNKKITGLKATLFQNTTYFARGKAKNEHKQIVQLKGPEVEQGEYEMWIPQTLRIPAIPPSRLGGICRIIDVQYSISIQMSISGLSLSMAGQLPVMIGTIPLRSTFDELRTYPPAPVVSAQFPPALVDGNSSDKMGFVLPSNSSNDPQPSTSTQHNLVPSAPFLTDYPDLPPPSYAEAVESEGFSWSPAEGAVEKGEMVDENDAGNETRDPSAPPMYSEFVPNYVTYKAPGY